MNTECTTEPATSRPQLGALPPELWDGTLHLILFLSLAIRAEPCCKFRVTDGLIMHQVYVREDLKRKGYSMGDISHMSRCDTVARNGVLHSVDTVLLPRELQVKIYFAIS